MILVDTSVWVDHLRRRDPGLGQLLEASRVLVHRFVIGEIALGSLKSRATVLGLLRRLPAAVMAGDGEVLMLVERHRLFGLGIGWVDAHLLAATVLTPGARLWTRDKRLRDICVALAVDHPEGDD